MNHPCSIYLRPPQPTMSLQLIFHRSRSSFVVSLVGICRIFIASINPLILIAASDSFVAENSLEIDNSRDRLLVNILQKIAIIGRVYCLQIENNSSSMATAAALFPHRTWFRCGISSTRAELVLPHAHGLAAAHQPAASSRWPTAREWPQPLPFSRLVVAW